MPHCRLHRPCHQDQQHKDQVRSKAELRVYLLHPTQIWRSDALETLDARQVHNTAETRRNLRLDAQQELIQCNGEIIRDFGQVAQVRRSLILVSI